MWVALRPQLDSAFVAAGKPRPTTFKDTANQYGPSLLRGFAKGLYDAGLRADAALRGEIVSVDTPAEVGQHFMDNCPPFLAIASLYACLMSWYQDSARDESGERFRAGTNGLQRYRRAMSLIVEDPEIQGGAATFKGTRLLVHHIAGLLQQGVPEPELREDYPNLTSEMIEAARIFVQAHPRRGRPRKPVWRNAKPLTAE